MRTKKKEFIFSEYIEGEKKKFTRVLRSGFAQHEANRLYEIFLKTNFRYFEDFLFICKVFEFRHEWMDGAAAYRIYCAKAKEENRKPVSATMFGRLLRLVTDKKSTGGGRLYRMSLNNGGPNLWCEK